MTTTLHHLMSASVPEAAREKLHQLVQARTGQTLHLQIFDLPEFLERMQDMGSSDELIAPATAFEIVTGVRHTTVPAISWMATDVPADDFRLPGLEAARFPIRDNEWWLNPDATLGDAVALVAA